MNVWIVNPFDNLPIEGNRPQRYWLMARAFARAGHRVTLWTSDFSHAWKARRKVKVEGQGRMDSPLVVESEGIEVRMISTLPYPTNVCLARIRSHRRLARDFEEIAMSLIRPLPATNCRLPTLIIASTPPLGMCAAAMRVARACGARFVCDIQDAWPETFGRLLPRGFKWTGRILLAHMFRTARRIYRESDMVTGVCRRYAELSGRGDFYLAYLGIAGAGAARRERKPGEGARRLAYIGNLGVGYGLDTVIEAVARRPGLTLEIAGKGPTEESLRVTAERLRVCDRVRFHGYLNEDALNELMASCDAGVIPMRDDSWVGLPNKLGDYLKAGLPVVSSLHGECGDLLERTGFGRTYDGHSPDSLLAALDALPRTSVTLPAELDAGRIYPEYVRHVSA